MKTILTISDEDYEKYQEWEKNHACDMYWQVAIGGKYEWRVTPTGLGNIVRVVCACGAKLDLTKVEEW